MTQPDPHWDADADRTQELPTRSGFGPDDERTQQLPVSDGYTDAERTRELPTYEPVQPMEPRREPVAVPAPQGWGTGATGGGASAYRDEAYREEDGDPHDSDSWRWQMARQTNKPSTDLGLLVLRLLSLPLVLHGLHKLLDFGTFASALGGNTVGAMAPEIIGVAIVTGQILLPLMIAVGALTRLCALLQAAMMGSIYAFWVLASSPVLDAATGGLSGEAALGYAALALPLFFTGAGRFSVDHGLTSGRRERIADKRVVKASR